MLPALIGAGASILGGVIGGNASKKAAKEAAAAQDRATQSNERIANRQFELAQQYIGPYAQAGVPALNALQSRVIGGSQPSGNALAPNKQGNAGGYFPEGQGAQSMAAPDWNAYINAPENRDILDHYNQLSPQDKARFPTPADFAREHWQGIGSTEGRAVTPFAEQAPIEMTQDASGVYGLPQDFDNAFGPRPTQEAFSFGQPQPTEADYFGPGKFQADPGYQWRLDQTLQGVTGNKFAQGLGHSGSRLTALQDRAGNLADQTYGDWWSRQNSLYGTALNQYNTNRNFASGRYDIDAARSDARYDTDRGFFNQDRGFLTDRFDRQTGDIFGLANIGQQGAAAVTGAGQNMSNALMQGNQNQADARGNAAIASANSTNSLIGNALTAYGMFGGGFGGGGGYSWPTSGAIKNVGGGGKAGGYF